jgi:hypothetical protein
MGVGRALAIVVVIMAVLMRVGMALFVIMALDPGLAFTATAYRTHLHRSAIGTVEFWLPSFSGQQSVGLIPDP